MTQMIQQTTITPPPSVTFIIPPFLQLSYLALAASTALSSTHLINSICTQYQHQYHEHPLCLSSSTGTTSTSTTSHANTRTTTTDATADPTSTTPTVPSTVSTTCVQSDAGEE